MNKKEYKEKRLDGINKQKAGIKDKIDALKASHKTEVDQLKQDLQDIEYEEEAFKKI